MNLNMSAKKAILHCWRISGVLPTPQLNTDTVLFTPQPTGSWWHNFPNMAHDDFIYIRVHQNIPESSFLIPLASLHTSAPSDDKK